MASPARLKRRRRPVQERSRETVQAILEAAAQVFERHGYAAGTTNRIAQRAGISVGSLYQYFPNKDAILVALTEQHLEEGTARLTPLLLEFATRPPSIEDGLRQLVGATIELHRHSPQLHRVLFEECPRPAALQKRLQQVYAAAVGAVEAWLRACPQRCTPDPRLAAELVIQVIEGVAHRLVIHPQAKQTPSRYADETVRLLLRYLLG
ncbi:MAG TPA: TetR/AcrR family transcriptional regulator [Solirubrobacteraceae bacterium]|nr:TetR/AcrR family transcriptional regulator [Solirubrobacteraceae bacterium]